MKAHLTAAMLAFVAVGCASECDGEDCATPPVVTVAEDGSPAFLKSNMDANSGEKLAAVVRMDTSESDPVPRELLGTWAFSHEECEAEGEPSGQALDVSITFAADRSYRTEVEGDEPTATALGDSQLPHSGTYTFAGGEYPRITLDNWLNFNVEGDTLQNWSEGDAVYLCGAVFERAK